MEVVAGMPALQALNLRRLLAGAPGAPELAGESPLDVGICGRSHAESGLKGKERQINIDFL